MSSNGNTFRCGIGRFNKFNVTDKPSNQQLHNENENKLSALLRLREEQDKGIFNTPISNATIVNITDKLQVQHIYTPFKYK